MPRTKTPKAWVMPSWMEQYRAQLADYGLGVEDLMNDHESTTFNNAYRALVCVGMKEQVGLLARLYKDGCLTPSEG
jgi:hypothetical protein